MTNKSEKINLLNEFGISKAGSEIAQVVLSCARIENLTKHIAPIKINEKDFNGMSQKGINILKSAFLGTGHKHDYSAKRAIQKLISFITNKLKYVKTRQRETYDKHITQIKERFTFIRNKS